MDAYATLHRSIITITAHGNAVTITGTGTPDVWQVMTCTRTITFQAPGCASMEQLLQDVHALVGDEDDAQRDHAFALAV